MIKIFILLLALISILQDLLIRHRLKKAFPERPWIHRIYLASFLLLDTLIVIALTCYRMAPDAASPRYVQITLVGYRHLYDVDRPEIDIPALFLA